MWQKYIIEKKELRATASFFLKEIWYKGVERKKRWMERDGQEKIFKYEWHDNMLDRWEEPRRM